MKSMTDLNLEGKYIQIFPSDSIQKWGNILHVTKEGIMVKVTKVNRGGWSSTGGWEVGVVRFISWTKLSFQIVENV